MKNEETPLARFERRINAITGRVTTVTRSCMELSGLFMPAELRRIADAMDNWDKTDAEVEAAGHGVGLISAERKRQIEVEGWTAELDARWQKGEMAGAAAIYALHSCGFENPHVLEAKLPPITNKVRIWPWADSWWKPKGRIEDLIRAGALIAAEIDRLNHIDVTRMGSAPESTREPLNRKPQAVGEGNAERLPLTAADWEGGPWWVDPMGDGSPVPVVKVFDRGIQTDSGKDFGLCTDYFSTMMQEEWLRSRDPEAKPSDWQGCWRGEGGAR